MVPLFKKFIGGPSVAASSGFRGFHVKDLAEAFVFLMNILRFQGSELLVPQSVRNKDWPRPSESPPSALLHASPGS